MIRPTVTLTPHKTKGHTYGVYLRVPVSAPLGDRPAEQAFLGRQGASIYVVVKYPDDIQTLADIHKVLPVAEWVSTAKATYLDRSDARDWPGLSIYIPKAAARELGVPSGKLRADVVTYDIHDPQDLVLLTIPKETQPCPLPTS